MGVIVKPIASRGACIKRAAPPICGYLTSLHGQWGVVLNVEQFDRRQPLLFMFYTLRNLAVDPLFLLLYNRVIVCSSGSRLFESTIIVD